MSTEPKLEEAKKTIGISDFKRDDLLKIALTEVADFNHASISSEERKRLENLYRRLAFLGDRLLDCVLADYLFRLDQDLTKGELDDWRQKILSKHSLTKFAKELGLPEYCSSWHKANRKPPEKEPRIWAEMFEAIVGVIFIDRNRDFIQISQWLIDNFFYNAVGVFLEDTVYDFEWEKCAFGWQRD